MTIITVPPRNRRVFHFVAPQQAESLLVLTIRALLSAAKRDAELRRLAEDLSAVISTEGESSKAVAFFVNMMASPRTATELHRRIKVIIEAESGRTLPLVSASVISDAAQIWLAHHSIQTLLLAAA